MLKDARPPLDVGFGEALQELIPKKKKRRTVHLHEARRILIGANRAVREVRL